MNLIRVIKNTIEVNQTCAKLFDKFTKTYIYRWYINRKIKQSIGTIKKTKTYNIIIETSNHCNAKCIMCPHPIMKRQKGIMSDDTFDTIIKKITAENIQPTVFILNGFGEPLTDTKIIERIKKLKLFFPSSIIKFYSNFNLANTKITNQLLNSGLDEINISLNGYDQSNYKKVMNLDFEKTIKNVEYLILKKHQLKSKMKIRISMTLVQQNDKSVSEFIHLWESKVDSISVNRVHTYNQNTKDTSGKFKINFDKQVYPCKYLWNTITISVNGDILLCCLDYDGRHNFGNINNQKILDIFYSKQLESIRKLHFSRNLKKMPICSNCYTPYKNGVEWLIDRLY